MITWRNFYLILTTLASVGIIILACRDLKTYLCIQYLWMCFWTFVGFRGIVKSYYSQPDYAKHPLLSCLCYFLVAGTMVTVLDGFYVAWQYLFKIDVFTSKADSFIYNTDDNHGIFTALILGLCMAIPLIHWIELSNKKYLK